MKKLAILLAACLLLLTFAACNNDAETDIPEDFTSEEDVLEDVPEDVLTPDVVPIEFDENNEALLRASDAYAYDEPIILENDDTNLGGWLVEGSPAAYWSFNLPEFGDYRLQFVYSRADEGEVEGWLADEMGELGTGQRLYFESTGDWTAFNVYTTSINEMEPGTHTLTLSPDDEDTGGYFINLESITIAPYAEEGGEEYVEEESFEGGLDDDGPGSAEDSPLAGTPLEGATFSVLAFDDVYYHHDSSNTNYQFSLETSTAQYNGESEIIIYDYAYDGNTLILLSEGEIVATMEIIDPCTLRDTSDGSTYAIPDSEGQELATNSYYYLNGDIDSSVFFRDDGTLVTSGPDGTEISGIYTNESGVLTVEVDGSTAELYIVNRRVLYTADGMQYLNLY